MPETLWTMIPILKILDHGLFNSTFSRLSRLSLLIVGLEAIEIASLLVNCYYEDVN